MIMPFLLNIQLTQPGVPMEPPPFSKIRLISGPVRLRLSVSTSTRMATPLGPYPSYWMDSKLTPSPPPVPFLIAFSMVSLGMLAALALSIA